MNYASKFNSRLISLFFVLALTCIHLGKSEYFSVQFISVALLTVWLLLFKHISLKRKFVVNFLALAIFWLSITLIKQDTWEVLVVLRMLFMILFVGLVVSLARSSSNNYSILITTVVKLAAIITLCLSILQLVEINMLGTSYSFLESKYYALSFGTTDKDISTSTARAKALFSEPSTLGAWGFIVAVIGRMKGSSSLMILGIINCLLSSSLVGISCLLIYFSLGAVKSFISFRKRADASGLFLVIFVLSVGYFVFSERILFIFSGGELSAIIRVIAPVSIIQDLFMSGEFFGESKSFLSDKAYLDFGIKNVFDNFILNLIMLNGLFGFVLIFSFYKLFNRELGLILVLLSVVNGDPFYWDRAIFLFVLIVATGGIFSATEKPKLRIMATSNERRISS